MGAHASAVARIAGSSEYSQSASSGSTTLPCMYIFYYRPTGVNGQKITAHCLVARMKEHSTVVRRALHSICHDRLCQERCCHNATTQEIYRHWYTENVRVSRWPG